MEEEVVNNPLTEEKSGDKTDPNLLLKSLQEEREKRRELERKLLEFKHDDVISDEGKYLNEKIEKLQNELETKKVLETRKTLESTHPALLDKKEEFEEYLNNNPGMKIETAAKSFLIENDLFEHPQRIGLESKSGTRVVPEPTQSVEEIANLRNTDFRKYMKLVREGKVNI